jgi:hypothetical protein
MSTTPDNGRRRAVITAPVYGQASVNPLRVLYVMTGSIVLHGAIIALAAVLFFFISSASGQETEKPTVEETTVVEDQKPEPDLTNDNLGIDDTMQTNYNVDRIEDVSVPGPVDPTAPVGVPGAPDDAIRQTVPPPPGTGGGSGLAVAGDPGIGSMIGDSIGGQGGLGGVSAFAGRSGSTRVKMLAEGGGNARSEKAVADGLKWLALHQANDGRWSLHDFPRHAREHPFPQGRTQLCNCQPRTTHRNDIAATGFALLPFLAAGITNKPSREKHQIDYTKAVDAGLKYLIRQQNGKGFYGGDMYAHGIAAIAMCEAYGLTSDPTLKRSAQRALDYIYYAQDPKGGGWRYQAQEPGDTSVAGWQVMAIKSGQMSGLTVPKVVLEKAKNFLNEVEGSKGKGTFQYMRGSGETPTMTAVGLLCRMYGGINPRNPALISGVSYLKSQGPPGATNNMYYLYYATQVMHHMGGDYWDFWNLGPNKDGKLGIRDSLISTQDTGGTPGHNHQIGSWETPDQGGRLMSTSLSLLCLEVYYRHLPLYRRDMGVNKAH